MKKNIQILFTALLIVTMTQMSFAQVERYFDERYIYSHSFLQPVLMNAGATAFHGGHQLMVNYRNKWSTFDDAPRTITLGYDGVLADRLGIGVQFMQDNFGSLRSSKGLLAVSYKISGASNDISFGLSTEYIQHGLNTRTSSDEIFDPNDPLFRLRNEGASFLDVSFGAFGKYMDKFTYGIALPSLISSRIDNEGDGMERSLGFIANLGYRVESSTGISIEPSIVLKRLNKVPTHVDLNARLGFLEDKFTGGVSYTIGADKKLGFLIGFAIDKLNLFYTYNSSMQDFQDYNNGSHEITVRLRLNSSSEKKEQMEQKEGM